MRETAGRLSERLNWLVERVVALLMVLLVLDVWLGVIDRYLFHWQLPWPEVVARYLMIWAALLAVSCGIARREHIGLSILISRIPGPLRRIVLVSMDGVAFLLFFYIAWFGIGFAGGGASRQAMIFGMTLALPFAAIPVSAGLAMLQLVLTAIRDLGTQSLTGQAEA
ncbi:TRAP transporter small permease [Denitrobaculum tricleocarpae]|uniref:TRAP transporter small permease protein n=1 Tax=Denitrobaculum tricleocarpae TaxID=2591009 RepID=A0A545U1K6_9PROT|nr:TRAP transporter small permease [Denitrobaculum tricleocarpae]TQV83367.1 TRAP transporter small permease [Denitrobaculum tricleocarpae]